jgi:hypothetical protein
MKPTRLVAMLGSAALLAFASLAFLPTAACSSDEKALPTAKAPPPVEEGLEHEKCDESGNRVEMLDTNGDGKPDIRRVFDKQSQRELCRVVDLNRDGKPDLYEYFDSSGTVRRREFCYDDTGAVNAIEHYENGQLTKREYDTNGMHKIDTWDYFDPGLPVDPKTGRPLHPSRRERDVSGDGHVDQWWVWDGNKVSISRDTRGDGKPDPASTVVLDQGSSEADGGAGARPAVDGGPAPASASDAGGPGATPPPLPDAGAGPEAGGK